MLKQLKNLCRSSLLSNDAGVKLKKNLGINLPNGFFKGFENIFRRGTEAIFRRCFCQTVISVENSSVIDFVFFVLCALET